MATPVPPPLDSSLLLHDLVNFHMQNNPTFPMYVYAEDHGTTEISLLEFGRAAHRIAHVLRPGRKGDGRQVVMIIANCDTILYQAIHVALCVAGLTVSGSSRCPEKKTIIHCVPAVPGVAEEFCPCGSGYDEEDQLFADRDTPPRTPKLDRRNSVDCFRL